MFAFVVPTADRARHERCAAPGIELAREPDSLVVTVEGGDAPALRVNEVLDRLALLPDLEGVVVLHEDLVLEDPAALVVLRDAFAEPSVAIAGLIGAAHTPHLAWWEGEATGRLGTPHVPQGAAVAHRRSGTVATVDGAFLALSPWAVRTLRFDAAQARDFHGYDVDLCATARHHGRRVVVVPIAARHEHHARFSDADRWARSDLRYRARWTIGRALTTRLHEELTSADR